MLFNLSKQRLIENFLDHELRVSKNKKSEKVVHIINLFNRNNKRFIVNLYRNILLREPDTEGYNHYINLLKEGKTKQYILDSFAGSPEARKINVKIVGSKKFFKIGSLYEKLCNFLIKPR